jgi:signal transduction histidine kinase
LIAGLLVLVSVLGLLALGQSNSRVERLAALQQRAAVFRELQTEIQQIQGLLGVRAIFVSRAATSSAQTLAPESFFFLDRTMTSTLSQFGDTAATIQGFDYAVFQRVFSAYSRLLPVLRHIVIVDETGKLGGSRRGVARASGLTNNLAGLIRQLTTKTQRQVDALVRQNRGSYAHSRDVFIGVAAGSVMLALLLGFVLSWSLVDPLRRTEARLRDIAAGDFSRHIDVSNRDELGVLAANVNRMNDQLARLYGELETASRHKSDFLATMSHELRTPLNAIIGFSEVLSEQMFGELNERQKSYVDDVLEAARHLLSLINDVLDLAKVEAGRLELDLGPVSIPDVLRGGLTMHAERARRSGIALDLALEQQEITVEADERRVRQVVYNLLSNAVKFTPADGRIDVAAAATNGVVEVSVADTGTGISPEDCERIFEEFEQARDGSKREGTGLGLALSRKFIELHGGRLWVESSLGEGSTFRFTLPVRSVDA